MTDQRLLRTASDRARRPTQVVEHTSRKIYRDDAERAATRLEYFAVLWMELQGSAAWKQNSFLFAISHRIIKANINVPEARVAA